MDKLSNGLAKLAEEDPTFTVTVSYTHLTVRPVFVREGDVLTAELNLLGTAADVRQEFIIVLIDNIGLIE